MASLLAALAADVHSARDEQFRRIQRCNYFFLRNLRRHICIPLTPVCFFVCFIISFFFFCFFFPFFPSPLSLSLLVLGHIFFFFFLSPFLSVFRSLSIFLRLLSISLAFNCDHESHTGWRMHYSFKRCNCPSHRARRLQVVIKASPPQYCLLTFYGQKSPNWYRIGT